MNALVFLAKKSLQLKWQWLTTLLAYDPDQRNRLSRWLSRLYLVYGLLFLTGVVAVMGALLLETAAQAGRAMPIAGAQLLQPLWLLGVGAFSLLLYLAVRAQPAALTMADLNHLAPAPLESGTYLLYRLLGTWTRQGLSIWPVALVGLVAIGGMLGGASPGRLVTEVVAVALAHLALVSLSWVYGLGRLKYSHFLLKAAAWLPLTVAGVGALVGSKAGSGAGEWLLPPVAAATRLVTGTTQDGWYPWGLSVLELGLAALAVLLFWRLAHRLPMVLIAQDSWEQAVHSDAVRSGEVHRVRGIDAAKRLRRRPATGASALIRGSGAVTLLGRSALLLVRGGPWPPLRTAFLAALMPLALAITAGQTQFNIPLALLFTVIVGGRSLTGQLQGDIYHEEFLYLLPVDARWAVAVEILVPAALMTTVAWPVAWVAALFFGAGSAWAAALALATPGLVWLLALTWAYETLLGKDGLAGGWSFLPYGAVGVVLTLVAWGLVAVVAWPAALLLGPAVAGLAALVVSGLMGYLVLDRCALLYRTGYII